MATNSMVALRHSSAEMFMLVVWAKRTTMRLGKKMRSSLC